MEAEATIDPGALHRHTKGSHPSCWKPLSVDAALVYLEDERRTRDVAKADPGRELGDQRKP